MGRSRLLAIVIAVGTLVTACSSASSERPTAEKPNLVVLLLDDLDNTTMPYWDAMPRTHELIAERGVEFTNNFATDPVCCPARATIITGRYPHNTGVYDHTPPDGGYETFVATGAEQDTLATRLQKAGYTTAFMGKYLNGYEETPSAEPPGWDDWFGLAGDFLDGYGYQANENGEMVRFDDAPEDYQTDVLSRRANAFVDNAEEDDERPFLLFIAPSAPHAPIAPAPRHADNQWRDDTAPTRPNYNEADVSDKPTWLRLGKAPIGSDTSDALTLNYRNAMGSLLAVDELVAALVERLDAAGELDDTYLVLTSDNGQNYGAHRLINKQVPYEESIRVPLTIAGPGVRHDSHDALVTHLDYAPTLLDLAGTTYEDLDGQSLAPLLERAAPKLRENFLVEYTGTYNRIYNVDTLADVRAITENGPRMLGPPTYRALRTERQLYVQWYGGNEHEFELYDLDADPYQLDNLLATEAGRQQHVELVAELQARLEELATCKGATCH